jgi:hypothetical protein
VKFGIDVLDDQAAHDEPAVEGVHEREVREDLDDDGGAAEGDETAEEEAELEGHPLEGAEPGGHADGEGDLEDRGDEGARAEILDPAGREAHAQDEHEQDDPDLAEHVDLAGGTYQPQAVGADQDAADEVGDDRGLLEPAEQDPHDESRGQDDADAGENPDIVHSGASESVGLSGSAGDADPDETY